MGLPSHLVWITFSGFIASSSAPSAPFPLPSSVPQHQESEIPAWKKLQNRLVYELINVMATDSSVLFLVLGRNWISWLLPLH